MRQNITTTYATIEDKSQMFRWLVDDEGSFILQVSCPWNDGSNFGIEWRSIPIVKAEGKIIGINLKSAEVLK